MARWPRSTRADPFRPLSLRSGWGRAWRGPSPRVGRGRAGQPSPRYAAGVLPSGLAETVRSGPAERSMSVSRRPSFYTDARGIAQHLAITERHVPRLVLERRIPHRKIGNLLRFE